MREVSQPEFDRLPDGVMYLDRNDEDAPVRTKSDDSFLYTGDVVYVLEAADLHRLLARVHTALSVTR